MRSVHSFSPPKEGENMLWVRESHGISLAAMFARSRTLPPPVEIHAQSFERVCLSKISILPSEIGDHTSVTTSTLHGIGREIAFVPNLYDSMNRTI